MSSVSALKYQTLFDVVIQATGTLDGALAIAAANNLSVTSPIESGTDIEIPADITRDKAVVSYLSTRGIKPASGDGGAALPGWGAYWLAGSSAQASSQTVSMKDQTFFDLAVQIAGSIENVFALAAANGVSVTRQIDSGLVINTPDDLKVNARVVNYLSARGIKPASDTTSAQASALIPEGIGYWIIETDFIVS